jgi:hypothetical protein
LALFRVSSTATALGAPLLEDPAWDSLEAVQAAAHRRPRGRLSNIDPARRTGQILCFNADYTTSGSREGGTAPAASRVRVLAETEPGKVQALGDVPVQADGSFMAEVPTDLPLGFEALDEQGRVVRRVAPMVWVRPGENRSCIGCHPPPNRSPHNHQPLAVREPVPLLGLDNAKLAGGRLDP